MLLLEVGDDLLPLIYEQFHMDKLGATKVWRLVCKAMRDVAPKDKPSWLRAMGVSSSLVAFFYAIHIKERRPCDSHHKTILVNGMRKSNYCHELVLAVAKGGNPKVLLEIREWPWVERTRLLLGSMDPKGDEYDQKMTYTAAKAGDLDMLKLLLSIGLRVGQWACAGAARGGHMHILDWLLKLHSRYHYGPPRGEVQFYDNTLKRHHTIRLIEHFHEFGPVQASVLVTPAVKSGNLAIVKRVVRAVEWTGDEWDLYEWIASLSVYEDSVDIFRFAIEKMSMSKDEFDARSDQYVSMATHFDGINVLQYLLGVMGDDFPVDEAYAGWDGNVAVFKWLVEKAKMPVDGHDYSNVLCHCDTKDALELLDYLHSIDCTRELVKLRAPGRHVPLLDLYADAARFSGQDALKRIEWLHAHAFPLTGIGAMESAIANDELCVVQKLHELGCVLTRDSVGYFHAQPYWDDDGCVARWIKRDILALPTSGLQDNWLDGKE